MKLSSCKIINLLSNGSITLSSKGFLNNKQFVVTEKDHKNFYLNKKKVVKNNYSDFSSEYKNKYLI